MMHTPAGYTHPEQLTSVSSDLEEFLRTVRSTGAPVGFDTETVGCDPRTQSPVLTARCVCWSAAVLDDSRLSARGYHLYKRYYFDASTLDDARVRAWLQDPSRLKVGHNLFGFDYHVLKNHGITLAGIADTRRMHRLWKTAPDTRHGLKHLQEQYLRWDSKSYKELFSRPRIGVKGQLLKTTVEIPLEDVADPTHELHETLRDYASMDAAATLCLYQVFDAEMPEKLQQIYWDYWTPLSYILSEMESVGIELDAEDCHARELLARKDLTVVYNKILKLIPPCEEQLVFDEGRLIEQHTHDINLQSPAQLAWLLYGQGEPPAPGYYSFNLPVSPVCKKGKTKKDKFPTDSEALQYLADHNEEFRELGLLILEWRRITSSIKYLAKLPRFVASDGRVHCQMGPDTTTGRLAVRNPELQQMPKEGKKDPYGVRRVFVPREGYVLVAVDESQLEMRILAHILIALFDDHSLANDIKKADPHSANAIRIFGQFDPELARCAPEEVKGHSNKRIAQYRDDVKAVAYGMNYGKGDVGMGASLRDENNYPIGEKRARQVIDAYLALYPGLSKYYDWVRETIKRDGRIPTLLGRYRDLPDGKSSDKWRVEAAWRAGLNAPMQGGAMDIMAMAMLRLNTFDHPNLRAYRNRSLVALGAVMLLQVHDELVFECPAKNAEQVISEVKRVMNDPWPGRLKVPLDTSGAYGYNWGEAK